MNERRTCEGREAINDVDVSVVMACYTEERLDSIKAALTSLQKQSLEPRRVIVAVGGNESLANRLRQEFVWLDVVVNHGDSGASSNRNYGVEFVDTEFTAFLDDDETADPDWLLELTRPFHDSLVVGTGGKYEPVWASDKPAWFPDEFAWVVGGAYLGLPTETSRVRNVWSGNMAVRTAAFRSVGGFRTNFGKRGGVSQPEDTDLCIRVSQSAGGHWMYVPSAVIFHDVPDNRATLRYFVSRNMSEGSGKALMRAHLTSSSAVKNEHDYVRATAKAALKRFTSPAPAAVRQGLVMLTGLTYAAVGYLRGRVAALTVGGPS